MKAHLLIIIILILNFNSNSQEINQDSIDPNDYDIKASFNNGNLDNFLYSHLIYPMNSIRNQEKGTVLISFLITKQGTVDSIDLISFPSNELAVTAINGLMKTNGMWNPTYKNGEPINYKYLIAIRFSMYLNELPPDYLTKANEFYKKEKFDKAIKYFTKAIELDNYNQSIYYKRSSAYYKIGDTVRAKQDKIRMYEINKVFIGTNNISAIGQNR